MLQECKDQIAVLDNVIGFILIYCGLDGTEPQPMYAVNGDPRVIGQKSVKDIHHRLIKMKADLEAEVRRLNNAEVHIKPRGKGRRRW